MIYKYLCPFCYERLANVYDLTYHMMLKHGKPYEEEEYWEDYWLNPTRRDNVDAKRLRKRFENKNRV